MKSNSIVIELAVTVFFTIHVIIITITSIVMTKPDINEKSNMIVQLTGFNVSFSNTKGKMLF